MGRPPRLDEHAIIVDAPATDAWAALLESLDGWTSSPVAAAYAKAIRCEPSRPLGPRPLGPGSTVPGFAVTEMVPVKEVVLAGRHLFSNYALTFRVRPAGSGRTEIRAESHAEFPAPHGRLYRLLVIGTGFHVVAVRRLLESIRQRAEAPAQRRPA